MNLHPSLRNGLPITLLLIFLALITTELHAQPVLRCELTYAGTTHLFEAHVKHDAESIAGMDTGGAYTTEALDIGGRFRVKALLLGTTAKLSMIKIYIYYETDREPVLLQEVKYTAPFAYASAAQQAPYSLTGLNYLYSPPLGRELQYGCALVEAE